MPFKTLDGECCGGGGEIGPTGPQGATGFVN